MSEGKDQIASGPKRGRKPKDKSIDQYSIKQISVDDSQTKKKSQRGRKTNQSKQQNLEELSSLQLGNNQQEIDQQDTVFSVTKPESSNSQNQNNLEQDHCLQSQPLDFINSSDLVQDSQNIDQFQQLSTGINNIQIDNVSQSQEQEIQVVDNLLSSSIFQSPPLGDLKFKPDQKLFDQKNSDQQTKKKKEDKNKLQIPSHSAYLKIQQRQGKTFQEKELSQIVNLSNKDQKWPQSVQSWCCYDCHPFTTTPIGIPVEITPDRKFKMQSYCCSLNCVMALIHLNNNLDLNKQVNYLMEFQRQFFDCTENIPRAPAKELLKQFGGEYSIEQFRRTFKTFEQSLYSRLNEPFVQQGQSVEKINPQPQYDTNKSIPTELQVYKNY